MIATKNALLENLFPLKVHEPGQNALDKNWPFLARTNYPAHSLMLSWLFEDSKGALYNYVISADSLEVMLPGYIRGQVGISCHIT